MNIIEKTYTMNGTLQKRSQTKRIILHHAAAANCTADDVDRWHKGNGWTCIGYHFFVNKKGEVFRGRQEETVGAHAYGSNSDSIGICLEGNFENETMPEEQKRAGQELVAMLKEKYGITKVQGHRDVCSTSCPGKKFPFKEIVDGKVETVEESGEYEMKKYVNGNKRQNVYRATECRDSDIIGTINPNEICRCYGVTNGLAIIVYDIDRSTVGECKVGFVKDLSGIK